MAEFRGGRHGERAARGWVQSDGEAGWRTPATAPSRHARLGGGGGLPPSTHLKQLPAESELLDLGDGIEQIGLIVL